MNKLISQNHDMMTKGTEVGKILEVLVLEGAVLVLVLDGSVLVRVREKVSTCPARRSRILSKQNPSETEENE